MRLSRLVLAGCAAAAVIAAAAVAQTAPPPGAPPAPPFQQGGDPGPGPMMRGPMMHGGMMQGGMNPGGMMHGAMDPQRMEEMRIAREAHRDARRAMMAEGRIAALRGGLRLTPEQEPLWKPVEEALRAMSTAAPRMMGRGVAGQAMDDPIGRLRAGAERARARADAMTRLADAAAPLHASLSDEQKLRLRALMGRGGDMMGGQHMQQMRQGQMRGGQMDHGRMGRQMGDGRWPQQPLDDSEWDDGHD